MFFFQLEKILCDSKFNFLGIFLEVFWLVFGFSEQSETSVYLLNAHILSFKISLTRYINNNKHSYLDSIRNRGKTCFHLRHQGIPGDNCSEICTKIRWFQGNCLDNCTKRLMVSDNRSYKVIDYSISGAGCIIGDSLQLYKIS